MITVIPAGMTHVQAIAEITEEMDRFYGATKMDPAPVRISQIREALFSDPPSAHALLAWDDGKPVICAAACPAMGRDLEAPGRDTVEAAPWRPRRVLWCAGSRRGRAA